MDPRTHALVSLVSLVVVVLWQEAVVAQRGLCTGTRCFRLFQDAEDFPGAQRGCRDSGGELMVFSRDHVDRVLRGLPGGPYWLQSPGSSAEDCPSVSGSDLTVVPRPCSSSLRGFLCQYSFEEPCGVLRAGGGIQVNYTTTTTMNFQVEDSDSFPPGTIAVAGPPGAPDPDSRHVCFSGGWMRAPWSCEVLNGGCAHTCSSAGGAHTCNCPPRRSLHHNNITCTAGPCEAAPCTGEGEECVVEQGGGHRCECAEGFLREEGVCVNVTVCQRCEHMLCKKVDGVYGCACRGGFIVAPYDPTKCQQVCTERDCHACIHIELNQYKCFCPDGYIQDVPDATNSTPFCTDIDECEGGACEHGCHNSFGSFRCSCDDGFRLQLDRISCEADDYDGSGSTPHPYPTPAGAAVPSYVKTGSLLGIAVFMALCAALLIFVIRNAFKRCGKFELSTFKHPDIDIYYLQQVSTETYKRLSIDRQFNRDSQIF